MNPKIQKRLLRVASELNKLESISTRSNRTAKALPPELEKAFDMLESAAQHEDVKKLIDDLYVKMTGRV